MRGNKAVVLSKLVELMRNGTAEQRVQAADQILDLTRNGPLIIQLLGFARAGKDWTASQLKAYFESQGKSVELYSYAAPMKQIAATLFDITLEQLDNYKNHPLEYVIDITQLSDFKRPVDIHNTNFRRFLQLLGNEAIKPVFGDNVWAKLAKENIAKSTADIVIIPDCRFAVELEAVGGVTVRVVNNSLPPPMNHSSELELIDYKTDYVLNNTDYKLTEGEIIDLAKRILNENL